MTRAMLVLLCLGLLVLALLGMRRGWRNRLARQADLPPLPTVPPQLGDALLRSRGLYVGSTFGSSWQDRVIHDGLGLRADATASLYGAGVLLERQGTGPIFIPIEAITDARLAAGLAGKVTGAGGLLVIGWRLGPAVIDTGFRADDKTAYPDWVRTINGEVHVER